MPVIRRQPLVFNESPATAALRFALEVVSWIAIYFAWGWIAAIFAIAALSLFSVPGDKHVVLVRVPGPVRIALEVAVAVLGVVALWWAWDEPLRPRWGLYSAAALLAAYLLLFAVSSRRWWWMWRTGQKDK